MFACYLRVLIRRFCIKSSSVISVKMLWGPAMPALAKKMSSLPYVDIAWPTTSLTALSFAASNSRVWTSTLGKRLFSSRL